MKKNPKKWYELYPQGTKEGDEELKFFNSLANHPKYEFRSISIISKEAALTKERIEQIINKYYKLGLVYPKADNEEYWAYWERVPNMVPENFISISNRDKQKRVEEKIKELS